LLDLFSGANLDELLKFDVSTLIDVPTRAVREKWTADYFGTTSRALFWRELQTNTKQED
jgi:hypothetical protein